MAREIEMKFLVSNDSYRQMAVRSESIRQGYLSRDPERTVRVRIKADRGFLTVKGKNIGASRPEFEFEIPLRDARQLLELCIPPVLEKVRYEVPFANHVWEVDEFLMPASGLVTAEIELQSESEPFEIPPFVGANVTGNPAYYNSNLMS